MRYSFKIGPYGRFSGEGGKFHRQAKPVADSVGLIKHMRAVTSAARTSGLRLRLPTTRGDVRLAITDGQPDFLAFWVAPLLAKQHGSFSAKQIVTCGIRRWVRQRKAAEAHE